jgi:hypothetical protein
MGNQAFCAELIAKYGPEGTKQKGLGAGPTFGFSAGNAKH